MRAFKKICLVQMREGVASHGVRGVHKVFPRVLFSGCLFREGFVFFVSAAEEVGEEVFEFVFVE
jgi:hypothetical protein